MTELRWAEKVAWVLGSKSAPNQDFAFLRSGDTIYFSRSPRPVTGPYSAIVQLIQGIYEHDPAFARRHVRNRIFATATPTPMCLGMIRVAARRLYSSVTPVAHDDIEAGAKLVEVQSPRPKEPPHSFSDGQALPQKVTSPAHALEVVEKLAREQMHAGLAPRHASDRAIAAALVDESGAVLSYGVNTNARNRTLHAEVNLLQGFYARTGKPVPARASLYSSMKPCRMCAAMLWQMCEDVASIKVVYAEFDPGPNAKETILDAGSFDRKQACSDSCPELIALQLEAQA